MFRKKSSSHQPLELVVALDGSIHVDGSIAHVGIFKVLGKFRCKFLVKFRGIWTWGSKFC